MISAESLVPMIDKIVASIEGSRPLAYLDPGSGSFLLQLLAAGVLGGLFVLRTFWGRIKARFSRRERTDEEDQDRE